MFFKAIRTLAVLLVASAVSSQALASALEEVTIVGNREAARVLPGSSAVIEPAQIRIEANGDINQLLKTVPGIYIQEEDGYGLRPNIGIRGASSERSSKVTLLEDGVMVAPAPYSNPAAYYFPTVGRMHAIEVLKGAPLLRFGPQTTGGVVNLISTPIPDASSGKLNITYGQNSEASLWANYGGRSGNFGYLLETSQRRSEGYKTIDRSADDTGYDIEDYLLKLGWEDERQSLLLKAQYSRETSNETYLGLSDVDFGGDQDRRYGLSRPDEMNNDHRGYSLVYRRTIGSSIALSATAYNHQFSRDWFKLDGGSSLINAANSGDSHALAVLAGTADAAGFKYKHNNRDYQSRGLELNVDLDAGAHQLAIGGRLHEDEMDRFQPLEFYDQVDGQLVRSGGSAPSGSDNRIESAEAISFWAVDSWQLAASLNINLALRYEDVESERRQFLDPSRGQLASVRGNRSAEWLPGASFTYDIDDHWQLLAGVHRGFSPLGGGAQANEDPETSVNWEAGLRYRGKWFLEAIAFYSDFDNKSENCSNGNPCSNGATSGAFVTGEAVIAGLEMQAGSRFELGDFSLPLDLMYTYTDAAISADNDAEGFADGDLLAAIPEHIFSVRVGLESARGWDNYAVVKYLDEMCMNVGCNSGSHFERSESLLVVDYISRFSFNESTVVFLKLENAFDECAIVSRQPDGARPNKPRTAIVGVEWSF